MDSLALPALRDRSAPPRGDCGPAARIGLAEGRRPSASSASGSMMEQELSLDVNEKTANLMYDSQFFGIQLRIGSGRSDS